MDVFYDYEQQQLNTMLQSVQSPTHKTSYFPSRFGVSNQSLLLVDMIRSPVHMQTNSYQQNPAYENALSLNTSH